MSVSIFCTKSMALYKLTAVCSMMLGKKWYSLDEGRATVKGGTALAAIRR